MPSGLFYLNSLDRSISKWRDVWMHDSQTIWQIWPIERLPFEECSTLWVGLSVHGQLAKMATVLKL